MRAFWKGLFHFGAGLGENNYLSILIYHRVLEKRDPLRPETIDAQQFSQQMSWLGQYFHVLPLHEAVDLLKQSRLPRRAAAITFDDGYIDNLSVALPILQGLNLSASFYVSSRMLGAQAMWLDRMIEAVRSTHKSKVSIAQKTFKLDELSGKQDFLNFFENYYKSLPLLEANKLLEDLVEEFGGNCSKPLFMDELQLKELMYAGMEIGSHGRNHNILSALSSEEACSEISESRYELEQVIDTKIRGFAFPNGKAFVDFKPEHMEIVKKAGYQYALSTNYGCSHSAEEAFKLKRFTPWRLEKTGFLASLFLNYWYYQESV